MARPASDNTAAVWKFLRGKGFTPAQTAGIVGGLKGESGPHLDPSARNPTSGAIGIGQWLGGRARGVRSGDLQGQLRHLWSELQGPERAAFQRVKSAHTIEDAVSAWVRGFERPSAGEIASSIGSRNQMARDVFRRLGGVGGNPNVAAGGQTRDRPRGVGGSSNGGSTRTTTTITPGVDNSQARAALVQQFLGNRNSDVLDFALQARQLQDIPEQRDTVTQRIPGSQRISSGSGGPARQASGRTLSAHSPVGRAAKVIGTPHAGTHTLGNWQSDNAVDIAVPVGTPMVALQDGVVVKVRHHPQNGGRFAGDQITVRGANGNEYFYAHGVASVRPGQRIRKGQKLGRTGSANGVAHLHFGQQRGDPREHT